MTAAALLVLRVDIGSFQHVVVYPSPSRAVYNSLLELSSSPRI